MYEKRKYYLKITETELHFIIQHLREYCNKLITQGKKANGVKL